MTTAPIESTSMRARDAASVTIDWPTANCPPSRADVDSTCGLPLTLAMLQPIDCDDDCHVAPTISSTAAATPSAGTRKRTVSHRVERAGSFGAGAFVR